MVLVGPNTYYPLNAFSKKQTVVATSSTEAEVVAANHAMRVEGLPVLAAVRAACDLQAVHGRDRSPRGEAAC